MLTLIYLHGFLSSPRSHKATQVAAFARDRAGIAVEVPLLADRPALALRIAERAVTTARCAGPVALIGSSMGGFYATVLAERYDLDAVLVNPAVRPDQLLQRFFGVHRNPYTGSETTIGPEDAAVLAAAAPAVLRPARYWLLVQQDDAVLDYRDAVAYYHGCQTTIEAGGDHQFQGFERHLPDVLNFLQCARPFGSPPARG